MTDDKLTIEENQAKMQAQGMSLEHQWVGLEFEGYPVDEIERVLSEAYPA